jgi:uncharacterized UBP type Zn finger protein
MDKAVWPEGSPAAAAAENKEPEGKKLKSDEEEKEVIPRLTIQDALDLFVAPSTVENVEFSHLGGQRCNATVTVGLANFPDYLFVQLNKTELDTVTWAHKKIKVDIAMPDELDMTKYRSTKVEGEVIAPDKPAAAPAGPTFNEVRAASGAAYQRAEGPMMTYETCT